MKPLPDIYKRRRFTVNGYFAFPLTEKDKEVPNRQQWLEYAALLHGVQHGDFSRIHSAAERIAQSDDWVVQGLYTRLFGDAGSHRDLSDALTNLPVGKDSVLELAFGQAFEYWGHLSAIPALIDMYERYSFSDDARYVAQSLGRLMEDAPGEISDFPMDAEEKGVRRYCDMVRQHYEELCLRIGTHDAIVFRGAVVSIQNICRKMLDDLGKKRGFHEEMRHKFEAYTGIDCSMFYIDESPQPLAVAAIVEDFLAGPEVAKFEPGARYFFGNRVPDRTE